MTLLLYTQRQNRNLEYRLGDTITYTSSRPNVEKIRGGICTELFLLRISLSEKIFRRFASKKQGDVSVREEASVMVPLDLLTLSQRKNDQGVPLQIPPLPSKFGKNKGVSVSNFFYSGFP